MLYRLEEAGNDSIRRVEKRSRNCQVGREEEGEEGNRAIGRHHPIRPPRTETETKRRIGAGWGTMETDHGRDMSKDTHHDTSSRSPEIAAFATGHMKRERTYQIQYTVI